MKKSDFVLSLPQRLLLLGCVFVICYLITMGLLYVLMRLLPGNALGVVRIAAVLQDVLMFIMPAIVTAVLVTRRPAQLLCLLRTPAFSAIAGVGAVLLVSIPAQEAVIFWNANISLPESLHGLEELARHYEDAAAESMRLMMQGTSVGNLVVNILVVGIFAGFSEELLFRGCFQRLLTTAGVNSHVAVWTAAFFFSAMHFQLFGFVPRLLLGAYFGYLLLWTRSLWVPVAAHVLNNVLYAVTAWYGVRRHGVEALDASPELWSPLLTIGSAVLTVGILYLLWRNRTEVHETR
ncbi:MAG: CPBP family intramembrane metalloprotease [Muribaculaceae bacterium]|nr:CPBP family intramembrane metalloprotease [Muribaculaceae bacterium]